MQTADYPEVPDDFGHWLAGFIDGEGSFWISKRGRGGYQVAFGLRVRADELPILEEILAITGIGQVYLHTPRPRTRQSPQARWLVVSRSDLQRLVELLDRFPLRAKKARDFVVWRQAVPFLTAIGPGGPPVGVRAAWEPIARLREELIAVRAYDEARTTQR